MDEEGLMTMCRYCGDLYPLIPPAGHLRHDMHRNGCPRPVPQNVTPDGRRTCYSCGQTEAYGRSGKKIKSRFSENQREKGRFARCKTCVSSGRDGRFPQSIHEAAILRDTGPGSLLYRATSEVDVTEARRLLREGADPNFARQDYGPDPSPDPRRRGRSLPLWNADGTRRPEPEYDVGVGCFQPVTPLLSVCFSLSHVDHLLTGQEDLGKIARLLIEAGARIPNALRMAGGRYGLDAPDEPSNDVLDESEDMPAVVEMLKAHWEVKRLERLCSGDEGFDFWAYFASDRHGSNEKMVEASDILRGCASYRQYTIHKAKRRLASQKRKFFSLPILMLDGSVLPPLPPHLEVSIRAMAAPRASKVPDPLTT